MSRRRTRARSSVLDLNKVLDPEGHWTDSVDGVTVRISDRMHLSTAGADLAARDLVPQILSSLPRPRRPPTTSTTTPAKHPAEAALKK